MVNDIAYLIFQHVNILLKLHYLVVYEKKYSLLEYIKKK